MKEETARSAMVRSGFLVCGGIGFGYAGRGKNELRPESCKTRIIMGILVSQNENPR